jgi:hypothetical protein
MQLTYTSPDETTIKVTLDEGEILDDLMGPTEAFVPVDEGNRHYAAIQDEGLKIDAYQSPSTEGETNGPTPETRHPPSTAHGPERGAEHSRPAEPAPQPEPAPGRTPTRPSQPPRSGTPVQHGPTRGHPKRSG